MNNLIFPQLNNDVNSRHPHGAGITGQAQDPSNQRLNGEEDVDGMNLRVTDEDSDSISEPSDEKLNHSTILGLTGSADADAVTDLNDAGFEETDHSLISAENRYLRQVDESRDEFNPPAEIESINVVECTSERPLHNKRNFYPSDADYPRVAPYRAHNFDSYPKMRIRAMVRWSNEPISIESEFTKKSVSIINRRRTTLFPANVCFLNTCSIDLPSSQCVSLPKFKFCEIQNSWKPLRLVKIVQITPEYKLCDMGQGTFYDPRTYYSVSEMRGNALKKKTEEYDIPVSFTMCHENDDGDQIEQGMPKCLLEMRTSYSKLGKITKMKFFNSVLVVQTSRYGTFNFDELYEFASSRGSVDTILIENIPVAFEGKPTTGLVVVTFLSPYDILHLQLERLSTMSKECVGFSDCRILCDGEAPDSKAILKLPNIRKVIFEMFSDWKRSEVPVVNYDSDDDEETPSPPLTIVHFNCHHVNLGNHDDN